MGKRHKITGVTSCGTYETHVDYTIASLYHLVDNVIVINGGYDVKDIESGDNIPTERDTQLLKGMDVDKKITIFKPSWKGLLKMERGRDEAGRARNLSFASQAAYKLGSEWLFKVDSDTMLHHNITREDLEYLIEKSQNGQYGYRFGQYELCGDYEHYHGVPTHAPEDSKDYPSSNDAPLFYKCRKDDWYVGGGAPVTTASVVPYQKLTCYHARSCPPPNCEPYDYFYKRFWYHSVIPQYTEDPNFDISSLEEEIVRKAKGHVEMALHPEKLNKVGDSDDPRIPKEKPLVIEMGTKAYIQMKKRELQV